jgi:hypothetical protein
VYIQGIPWAHEGVDNASGPLIRMRYPRSLHILSWDG